MFYVVKISINLTEIRKILIFQQFCFAAEKFWEAVCLGLIGSFVDKLYNRYQLQFWRIIRSKTPCEILMPSMKFFL